MKIWYQSSLSLGADPNWSNYEKALVTNLRQAARPGTEVDVHGVDTFSPMVEKYRYVEFLNNTQIINNALKAQRDGYDAFAVGCMIDPAHDAVLELLDIPVVYIGQFSMHLACLLAPKFAFLSYNKGTLALQTEIAKRYGLGDRIVAAGSFHLDLIELQEGFKNPEVVVRPAREVAKSAGEAGAGVLIPTCGCFDMILRSHHITEIEGLPVLEGVTALLKMAELMVDLKALGIGRGIRGANIHMSAAEVAAVRKQYGADR